jgi:hypothetical protein
MVAPLPETVIMSVMDGATRPAGAVISVSQTVESVRLRPAPSSVMLPRVRTFSSAKVPASRRTT